MRDDEFLVKLVDIACKNINDVDYVMITFEHLLDMLADGQMDVDGICQLDEMLKNTNNAFENSELLMFLGKNTSNTSNAIFYNLTFILNTIYENMKINADPKSIEKTILNKYGESSYNHKKFFFKDDNNQYFPSGDYDRMDEIEDDKYIASSPFGKKAMTKSDKPISTVTFDDVAGIDSVKAELMEVVDFLKNPEKYNKLGAKIPKGVLLTGLPGVGKTLLAKAVAGEAGTAFITRSGSEFVEMYVGVGAKNVRELFEEARSYGTCVIFIDEIDALAGKRGGGDGNNSERDTTVNQLLVEMDGFASGDDNILIIGATNYKESLDSAVLRPGRFDRVVQIDLPDILGREAILKVHSKDKPFDETVDLRKVAEKTVGMSGADLANLLNESAILGARRDAEFISMLDIELASEKVTMGLPKEKVITEEEKILVAIHETGHALAMYLLPTDSKLHSLTIVPRGGALGYARHVKTVEKGYKTKDEHLDDIKVTLAGVVAEELFIGEVTGGCSSDLQHANAIAKAMIGSFGMNNSLVVTDTPRAKEVKDLLSNCKGRVKGLLATHREDFLSIVRVLLKKETLYASEVEEILGYPQTEKSTYSKSIDRFKKLL